MRRLLVSAVVGVLIVTVVAVFALAGAGEPVHGVARAGAQRGLASLPAGAWGPVSAALGRDDPGYRVLRLAAFNPAQRLSLRFTAAGVVVGSGRAVARLGLRAVGRTGAFERLGPVDPRVAANRVSYARGFAREWFVNGPVGVEQGFDVLRRPAGRGALRLHVAVSGAGVRVAGRGDALFSLAGGGVLRYAGLSAVDSRGRTLRARLAVTAGGVSIVVDDSGARYPVRVDPWVQAAELYASDGVRQGRFGYAVAVSGGTIVVGAPFNTVGSTQYQGAAYVFSQRSGGWTNATQTAELTASDGAANDQFGSSVAVSGDTIVVGASNHNSGRGAVYVFSQPSGGWTNATETVELTASDGAANNLFGRSVGVSGATIVVGAPFHAVGSNGQQGAVYVFSQPSSGWTNATQTAELTASDGAAFDHFGSSVAVSGGTVVAGAPLHAVGSNSNQGAVYVFSQPSGGWTNATQTAELTASDGAANDYFGSSVAVSGGTLVAGAPSPPTRSAPTALRGRCTCSPNRRAGGPTPLRPPS
jgi:FG-GAP repeat